MARRWADPSAFRADPNAESDNRPSWNQSIALIAVLVVVAGVIAAVSYLVRPDRARAFDLLHGSLLIGDQFGPVSVDLASGRGTLQIRGADQQAGVKAPGELQLVPFDGGTMLLNRASGEFNMVDTTGFLVKRDGGVTIAGQTGDTTATGIAAGQLAYIERTGSSGTDVLLVGPSTVATAAANPKSVKPRASYVASEQGVTADGGAASANGDLWALFRKGNSDVVRQLSLPVNSSTGASLTAANRGTVDQLSAIESATANADGTGNDVVGVASPGKIRIFAPGQSPRTVGFKAPAGLDTILPTTSARGRLSYLLHGTAGWSLVSVPTNGGGATGPTDLPTIDPDAQLATPAESLGSMYTMLRSGRVGTVYKIEGNGKVTAVVAGYPQKKGKTGASLENATFSDAYLVARESRVIVDSPGHYLALAVFTDGSHSPQTIEKTNLTSVNAANDADALTQGPVDPTKTATKAGGKAAKAPAPQINNKINCKQVNQKPHVPQIATVDPSARSVGLSWLYPILDSQDCQPSTYVVSVKLLSNNAPPAPGSVTLQGHLDTIIAGLYPSTQYELTVTAYINGQSTPSQPVRVTTGKEGPAAPKDISVSADSAGNWNLSWDGCGSVANKCVQTSSWTIKPYYCDDLGLGASPASMSAPADPSSVKQGPAVYKGGASLLGRSLEFRIQGTGVDGTPGDVSATSSCVQSWSPPNASAIHLVASSPPQTASSSAVTSTTARLKFDNGAIQDLGGAGATVTYKLLSDGRVITTHRSTSATAVSLQGIQAGHNYQVEALVAPPGHPDSSVQIGPVDVVPATAAWPTLTISSVSFDSSDSPTDGTLHVKFDLGGASTNGETFALTNSSVRCGEDQQPLTKGDVAPGDDLKFDFNRFTINGDSCKVTLQLEQDARTITSPPLYGSATTSSVATSDSFQIPVPLSTSSGEQFHAQWAGGTADPEVVLTYTGSDNFNFATGWQISVSNGSSTPCSTTVNTAPPTTLDVDKSCIKAGGKFSVSIQYNYFILQQKTFSVDVNGTAPQPVDPTKLKFTAEWNNNPALPQIDVDYTGTEDTSSVSPLQFTETVTVGNVQCGSSNDNPATSNARVTVDLTACPATDSDGKTTVYSIDISFTDPNYQQTGDYKPSVVGSPPS